MKRYLLLLYHLNKQSYNDFGLEEVVSLSSLYGWKKCLSVGDDGDECDDECVISKDMKKQREYSPFVWAWFPNEDVIHDICSRSVLIKGVYDVLAFDDALDKVVQQMQKCKERQKERQKDNKQDTVCASAWTWRSTWKTYRIRSVWFGKKCPLTVEIYAYTYTYTIHDDI